MQRQIIYTSDGSHTVSVPELHVTYHSIHGALQESMHVFIQAGLEYVLQQINDEPINVFEMGFGTGLNAFLTLIEAEKYQRMISYTAVELYPLFNEELALLNYKDVIGWPEFFQLLQEAAWNEYSIITDYFTLNKLQTNLQDFQNSKKFNLIYYDAFAPNAQPELWTKEIFDKLYNMMLPGGVLVTYCSKGDVRRSMQAAGFQVEKMPGPPRKREMLRASTPLSALGGEGNAQRLH